MRELTLDEKISIKGRFATRPNLLTPGFLAKLDMVSAVHAWHRIFTTPISYHSTPKQWRRDGIRQRRFEQFQARARLTPSLPR